MVEKKERIAADIYVDYKICIRGTNYRIVPDENTIMAMH